MFTLVHGRDPSLKIIHWPQTPPRSRQVQRFRLSAMSGFESSQSFYSMVSEEIWSRKKSQICLKSGLIKSFGFCLQNNLVSKILDSVSNKLLCLKSLEFGLVQKCMQHIWTQSSWCRDFQDHQPHHDVTKVNSQRTRLWTCSLKGRPMLNEAIYPKISKCIIITIVSNNYHQIIQMYHYPLVWSSQRLSSVFNQHLGKRPGEILNSLLLKILLFPPSYTPDDDRNGKKVFRLKHLFSL